MMQGRAIVSQGRLETSAERSERMVDLESPVADGDDGMPGASSRRPITDPGDEARGVGINRQVRRRIGDPRLAGPGPLGILADRLHPLSIGADFPAQLGQKVKLPDPSLPRFEDCLDSGNRLPPKIQAIARDHRRVQGGLPEAGEVRGWRVRLAIPGPRHGAILQGGFGGEKDRGG